MKTFYHSKSLTVASLPCFHESSSPGEASSLIFKAEDTQGEAVFRCRSMAVCAVQPYCGSLLQISSFCVSACVARGAVSCQHHGALASPPRGASLSAPQAPNLPFNPQSYSPPAGQRGETLLPDPSKPLIPAATLISRLIMIACRCNV